MTSAVQVTELSKTFAGPGLGACRALDRVTLSVAAGEMVALVGASGSGKSTLLRQIAGLGVGDRSGEASVTVLGGPMQRAGRLAADARKRRARVGFVFQQFNLVDRLSVLSNVLVGMLGAMPAWRGNLGLFSRDEKLAALHALSRVEMAEFASQRASTLSGGQQQRVAIARTLAQHAELVLADEPIASLDPESARRVMEALARINREDGRTVIVSLHQVSYAARYCHRAIALRDGVVVFDGPATTLEGEVLDLVYGPAASACAAGSTQSEAGPAEASRLDRPAVAAAVV